MLGHVTAVRMNHGPFPKERLLDFTFARNDLISFIQTSKAIYKNVTIDNEAIVVLKNVYYLNGRIDIHIETPYYKIIGTFIPHNVKIYQ